MKNVAIFLGLSVVFVALMVRAQNPPAEDELIMKAGSSSRLWKRTIFRPRSKISTKR